MKHVRPALLSSRRPVVAGSTKSNMTAFGWCSSRHGRRPTSFAQG